jgi:hypothetical protein
MAILISADIRPATERALGYRREIRFLTCMSNQVGIAQAGSIWALRQRHVTARDNKMARGAQAPHE